MAQQLSAPKRRGRPPTGEGVQIQVRLGAMQLAELDAWREAQPDKPSRPEALRRLAFSRVADA